MPDVATIEKIVLLVTGILLVVNLIMGFIKRANAFMWPVVTLLIVCAVTTVALAVIASQAHISWPMAYYWRYSYFGLLSLLMPLAYMLMSDWLGDGWFTTLMLAIVIVLICWLLGWLFNAFLALAGVVSGVYSLGVYLVEIVQDQYQLLLKKRRQTVR
ncbi:hypothetical protein KJ836_00170 [Patescibacteria group bacterium]|nr:hypothetical protein [Patescibacteria group bacterium]